MVRLSALALVVTLSACTTAPPPPPVLSYSAPADCQSRPHLAGAIALPPAKRKGETLRTPVDGTSPCLDVNGLKSPYLLYAMPTDKDRMVDVGGAMEQVRLLPPRVSLLGSNGETMRTFDAAQYQHRGDRYSVQFVPQEGERYILVTVDTALVGTFHESVQTGIATIPIGTATWTNGVDREVVRARSYHGAVLATVFDTSPVPSR